MKTVIEMAKKACAPNQTFNSDPEWLERFAALIREDEREKLSSHLMDYNQGFVDGVEEGRAMNKLEQAARQALEALIKANHFHDYEDEITALREALAEQAEQEPVCECHRKTSAVISSEKDL